MHGECYAKYMLKVSKDEDEQSDLLHFLQTMQDSLRDPPWSKSIHEILSAVSSVEDVHSSYRLLEMNKAAMKIQLLPFVSQGECEHGLMETNSSYEQLRRCWELKRFELESAMVRGIRTQTKADLKR